MVSQTVRTVLFIILWHTYETLMFMFKASTYLPSLIMVKRPGLERSTTVEPFLDAAVFPKVPPSNTMCSLGHNTSNSCKAGLMIFFKY